MDRDQTKTMTKVNPIMSVSVAQPSRFSYEKRSTLKLKTNTIKNVLQRNHPFLDDDVFSELMATEFMSGFEESESYFTELSTKAANLIHADCCFIFLKDDTQHNIYTFLKDKAGNEVRATKPLDRGITGFVVSDAAGIVLDDVTTSKEWSHDIDELSGGTTTKSYLAWPLWDIGNGECIGVVEFRNKIGGTKPFSNADRQFVRIFSSQVASAVTYSRQKALLAGRNEAFVKAYESNYDSNEAICIQNNDGALRPSSAKGVSRNAFTLAPSARTYTLSRINRDLGERGWDYDVFVHTEEELIMHTVDIFDERGLFSRFSIPIETFLNFLKEVKGGYSSATPYHNHYHAFDVMHVCYMLMTKCRADEYLESFNILSILVGALGHDLGHDGYNNEFHNTTNSELAVTYNGVSVLENYSAAYLFRILRKTGCNLFARMAPKDNEKMRTRLIDMILDTDAKNHFHLMTRFKHGLEMKKLSRGLLSSMILHVSDVSNPTRPGIVARKWAYAVQEEFFRQGDKEKELNLPPSPFMDRDYENLPRMQEAFIDAVVTPVFNLLAEFLPLVKQHCIKPLLINRAFWSNMQNHNYVKTADVVGFLSTRQEESRNSKSAHQTSENDQLEDDEFLKSPIGATVDVTDTPIPGIPASAAIEQEQKARKLSLVSFDSNHMIDEELGEGRHQKKQLSVRLRSPRRSLRDTSLLYIPKLKAAAFKMVESVTFQTITLLATIYALFANDLNLAVGQKDNDLVIEIGTICVLGLFVFELMVSLFCVPEYTKFFFWLDLIASLSLLFEMEIGWFNYSFESPDSLGFAKAGRAAKAGARAGRLAKVLRLIRLLKTVKLMKWIWHKKRNGEDNADEEVEMKMSVVGRKMTESITKKVIIAVMLMLLSFSLMDMDFTFDSRQIQLNSLADYPESSLLRQVYLDAHPNIIRLNGSVEDFSFDLQREKLRDIEIAIYRAEQNPSIYALFDIKDETEVAAWYSVGMTMIVSSLLAILSLLFSRDAYKIMIRPIEKMKYTVQQLSENPLLHLEKMKKAEVKGSNETDILEQAITKMATLLQIGFGSAGAEIIAKSFSDSGELDPMVPGIKVNAIFGFCDIRDFTFATEGLQQDVMLFVNKIAEIIHKHVIASDGAPNKNIGDAFLLVWKLDSPTSGGRSNLQKELFDAALVSFQRTIEDIKRMDNLSAFIQEETDDSAAWRSSLEDFHVKMGFGLHTGWAIEGSIGSKMKVDASYLSPHVNLASRLEAATKLYHVPLLMSEDFVSGLTGTMQSTCRRCDKVTFKGSNDPMNIYHQDTLLFNQLTSKPSNYIELLHATSWDNENELESVGVDVNKAIKSLESEKNLTVREVYEEAFNAYLDGDWGKCKVLCHLWMERIPGDVITHVLVEYLMQYNFVCPPGWKGHRALLEK